MIRTVCGWPLRSEGGNSIAHSPILNHCSEGAAGQGDVRIKWEQAPTSTSPYHQESQDISSRKTTVQEQPHDGGRDTGDKEVGSSTDYTDSKAMNDNKNEDTYVKLQGNKAKNRWENSGLINAMRCYKM